MNKKIVGFALSSIILAMLTISIYAVSATQPVTKTLTGTFTMGFNPEAIKYFDAGESGNTLTKIRGFPVVWEGDIAGSGYYYANMLSKLDNILSDVSVGTHYLEDVTITGIGVGDIAIGHNQGGLDYFIKSGSGDLSSIRGKGTITPLGFLGPYSYEFEVQINP